MERRRALLLAGGAIGAGCAGPGTPPAPDRWGAARGYPAGLAGGFNRDPLYRVGNYSGGYETVLPHNVVRAGGTARPLRAAPLKDPRYRWGPFERTPDDYLERRAATGLIVCRGQDVLFERYRMGRTAQMRLTSWSMAKSVTSLLLGICVDRGLVASIDDPAERYEPALAGTLHGEVTLRNLANMSSGAEVSHERDNALIYPSALLSRDASIARTVVRWNRRRAPQGQAYDYNELCPLTIGMVIRKVTGMSLSAFAQEALWRPMGAEADATWLTDAARAEFNCIGLAARLRDWARLGLLVADGGRAGATRVVGERWIRECTTWSDADRQVRVGHAMPHAGYKALMWHARADGSRPYFNGHHGQRVLLDLPTRTVLVHTAVDHDGDWQAELFAMFDAFTRL